MVETQTRTVEETFIRSLAGGKFPEAELQAIVSDPVRRAKAAAALLRLLCFADEPRVAAYFGLGDFRWKTKDERAMAASCNNFAVLITRATSAFLPLVGKPAALAAIRGQE